MTKPGDPPGEPRYRAQALVALGAAIADEARVCDEAARSTAQKAEAAVWLGASLADLGTVTGHTRQAARKRWPELGALTRRRRWLSHHVEEVLWAARLVLEHAGELPAAATGVLASRVAEVAAVFSDADRDLDPMARWHVLETLVDRDLRAVAAGEPDPAMSGQARFARDGAYGVVAYYDHATDDHVTGEGAESGA